VSKKTKRREVETCWLQHRKLLSRCADQFFDRAQLRSQRWRWKRTTECKVT